MADDADIYAALMGEPPKGAQLAAIANSLRNRSNNGRMLSVLGDDNVAGLGKELTASVMPQVKQFQDTRQKDQSAENTSDYQDRQMQHLTNMEAITKRGQDLAYDPKMLAAEAAMFRAQNPPAKPQTKAQLSAADALTTAQRARELADEIDKDTGAVSRSVDTTVNYVPQVLKGAVTNLGYTAHQQELRAQGKQLYQVLQKQMDGIRPNSALLAQTREWAPFALGDDHKQVAMKLRNVADAAEKQARAELTNSQGLYNGETVDDPYSSARANPPASTAARVAAARSQGMPTPRNYAGMSTADLIAEHTRRGLAIPGEQ